MRQLFFIFSIVCTLTVSAQRYKSSTSYIRFFSDAPLEDIEAVNEGSSSIIDATTKAIVMVVPIKSFVFEKSLMQEHFNENYLESDKYPNATFKGKIQEWDGSIGKFSSKATGTMEIHGVTQEVTLEGELEFDGKKMNVNSTFVIKLKDYKVKIPKAVFYNIAEEVEVTAQFEYLPYEKN